MSKQPNPKGPTMAETKEMAVREKKELAAKAEKTVPGRYFIPAADIYETDDALAVVLEMPRLGSLFLHCRGSRLFDVAVSPIRLSH